MPLADLVPLDTRRLFRPVSTELVALLRPLDAEDWSKPTIAGSWTVRDVVAHLVDLTFRRLSFHRDRMGPPPPPGPIRSEREFVDFINWLNGTWVDASKRLSPRVLTDLFELASNDLADWFEGVSLDEPALFGVSWAGEQTSENWFDIGREFVELWHHQQQIRLAVGAAQTSDPMHLQTVIAISFRGLPHAYRNAAAETGTTVTICVTGAAGGEWTLERRAEGWRLFEGAADTPTTRVTLDDDAAWRLVFNALDAGAARSAMRVEGRSDLAAPLTAARAVIV